MNRDRTGRLDLAWPWVFLVALALAALLEGCAGFPDGMEIEGDDDTAVAGDDDAAGDDDDTVGDDDTAGDPCEDGTLVEPGPADATCTSTEPYETFDPQMALRWQWTDPPDEAEHFQVLSVPLVIDLTDDDGDGQIGPGDVPDVVVITMANECYDCDGLLRAISGEDGSELWYDATLSELPSGIAPAAGELDPTSPGPEIVAKTVDNEVLLFSAAGALLRSWSIADVETATMGAFSLHDMDHDGEAEIIHGRVIMGADGTIHGVGEHGRGSAGGNNWPLSYAVDLDGDDLLEVVVGNAAYDKDGSAKWSNGLTDGTTAVGDFDLDGDPEIVVSGNGELRLQDHQGGVVWGPVVLMGNSGKGAPPTVADFDGDGYPEIGVADKYYYQVYDTDGSLLWFHETAETSSGITGSSVFDFNGDGTAEVVYADEETFYIFEGPTGATLFEEPEHSSRTNIEYPVIVDVDADGGADIVLPSNAVFEETGWNGVTALTGTNETGWWATRRIWNQHAYFVTNVDDDGTIPQYQDNPWEVHNSFRQARPETGWDGYPVADLEPLDVEVCDLTCPDEITLSVRVRNAGGANVVAGTPVTVFDATTLDPLTTTYVSDSLPAGWVSGSLEIVLDAALFPEPRDVLLWVDLFQDGGEIQLECDEINNGVTVHVEPCP